MLVATCRTLKGAPPFSIPTSTTITMSKLKKTVRDVSCLKEVDMMRKDFEVLPLLLPLFRTCAVDSICRRGLAGSPRVEGVVALRWGRRGLVVAQMTN